MSKPDPNEIDKIDMQIAITPGVSHIAIVSDFSHYRTIDMSGLSSGTDFRNPTLQFDVLFSCSAITGVREAALWIRDTKFMDGRILQFGHQVKGDRCRCGDPPRGGSCWLVGSGLAGADHGTSKS